MCRLNNGTILSDSKCNLKDKIHTSEYCNEKKCAEWKIGNWSNVSFS